MNDERVTRCLICGSWMIEQCAVCAKRGRNTPSVITQVSSTSSSSDDERPDIMLLRDAFLASRNNNAELRRLLEQARRLAVALEQENAALQEERCGCADLVEELHDSWTNQPTHQLAAWKIIQTLRGQAER